MADLKSFKEKISKQRVKVREQEMEGVNNDIRSRVNEATTNSKKRALLTSYKKFQEQGSDKESALMLSTMATEKDARSSGGSTFSPELTQATGAVESAKGRVEESGDTLKKYQGSLYNRWDNDVKDTLDSLTKEMYNPQYMEMMGAMGFSPQNMFALSKGRDSYIESFKDQVRKSFNNDILYFQQLREITDEAQKDYEQKSGFLLSERTRLKKEDEQKKINASNNTYKFLSVLDSMDPIQLAEMTEESLVALANSMQAEISPFALAGFVSGAKKISEADDEKRGWEESKYKLEIQKLMQDIQKGGISNEKDKIALAKLMKSMGQEDIFTKLSIAQVDTTPERPAGANKEFTGQCSAYVNDMLGRGVMFGSSLQSKAQYINSYNPTAGSVFISRVGNDEIGHVGFVESVNEDGTVTLVDSNRYGDKKINRRNVSINDMIPSGAEGILGYYTFDVKGRKSDQNDVVSDWGYSILDGYDKISNIQPSDENPELRNEVQAFVQEKRRGGYKSDYPVFTESQNALVNTISDDYFSRSKDIRSVAGGFSTVKTMFSTEEKRKAATGFDDISVLNAFQRMVDPAVSVREGDIKLQQSAISILELWSPSFKWAQFTNGSKLPENVRQDVLDAATSVYNEKAIEFNEIIGKPLVDRAQAAGIDFKYIGSLYTTYNVPEPGEGDESDDFIASAPEGEIPIIRNGVKGYVPENELLPTDTIINQ